MGPIRLIGIMSPLGLISPLSPMTEDSFLPPHGNYAELHSYQKSEIVYDLTCRFCQRFMWISPISPITPIQPTSPELNFLPVRCAASRWRCARRSKASMLARSSGAARPILRAKALGQWIVLMIDWMKTTANHDPPR